MFTWAVLAAKEGAIASGLGAAIVPVVGAGSLGGFAIGALMSGTCILMLTSPRRGRGRGLASAVRSRHRLPDQNESSKRTGARRSTPRHAAPSASFSARMAGRIGARALASGARS